MEGEVLEFFWVHHIDVLPQHPEARGKAAVYERLDLLDLATAAGFDIVEHIFDGDLILSFLFGLFFSPLNFTKDVLTYKRLLVGVVSLLILHHFCFLFK